MAARIRHKCTAISALFKSSLLKAKEAGQILQNVKDNIGHGKFSQWVSERCGISIRSADHYMKIAKHYPEIAANAQDIANLTFSEAILMLATPKDKPVSNDTKVSPVIPFTPRAASKEIPSDATKTKPAVVAIAAPHFQQDKLKTVVAPRIQPSSLTENNAVPFQESPDEALHTLAMISTRLSMFRKDVASVDWKHARPHRVFALLGEIVATVSKIREEVAHVA